MKLSHYVLLSIATAVPAISQTPVTQARQPAFSSEVKRAVVYLRTDCFHDYTPELSAINKAYLERLPLDQETQIVKNLITTTSKLTSIKAAIAKLSGEDLEYLRHPNDLTNDPASLATEGAWRASEMLKMTSLSPVEIEQMTPDEYESFPSDRHLGTGFLVAKPIEEANEIMKSSLSGTLGFTYLVTNRHVVQPGIEVGKVCNVPLRSFLTVNRKPDGAHPTPYAETSRTDKVLKWHFSTTDDSVDLAVVSIPISPDSYDFSRIWTDTFLTHQEMDRRVAVEGDPVLFSGLFVQFYDAHVQSLDPIVRSGTLALVPEGLLPTTIQGKRGHVFLTDAHAFGGNSGSPVVVDTIRFTANLGTSFKFLGVISGEVHENNDFTLTVTTTIPGTVAANSGVSMVVPGWQILDILDQPEMKQGRKESLEEYLKQRGPSSPSVKP